jgi:short-subunit dehydrogenase
MAYTALITGASGGIGLELARVCASNKINLVLAARSENKLNELATELTTQYGVTVKVIPADLADMNQVQHVYDVCKNENIQIDYLVNNAGFGDFGFFHELDWNKTEKMIDLNITALTKFCRLFIPEMVQRKNGKILNVASTAAFQPGPTMAVYYATKAYVLHFTEALQNELEKTGITVTALCPGATVSGFMETASLQESKLFKGRKLPTSTDVAKFGFDSMMKGKTVAIHGTMNTLMAMGYRFFPRKWIVKVTRMIQDKSKN